MRKEKKKEKKTVVHFVAAGKTPPMYMYIQVQHIYFTVPP